MTTLRAATRRCVAAAASIFLMTPAFACAAGGPAQPSGGLSLTAAHEQIENVDDNAIKAAVADGLTTGLALSAGAVELNPLVSTTPLGLIALTGAKIGLVKFAETLPEREKRVVIKTSTALWGGAAVSNLMVVLSAPTPLAIVAGIAMGVYSWRNATERYAAADKAIAEHKQLPLLERDTAIAHVAHAR